jgi:hypothetical protein
MDKKRKLAEKERRNNFLWARYIIPDPVDQVKTPILEG